MGRWSSQMTDKEVKGGREESEDGGRHQRIEGGVRGTGRSQRRERGQTLQ